MEDLRESVELDIEDVNELLFKVNVEGTSGPARVRLVCEGANGVSYMFDGGPTQQDGVVQFIVPEMKNRLSEGTYSAKVEVLIEGRYFTPVEFDIDFKRTVKVFAEAVQVPQVKKAVPHVQVTATPIVVVKPKKLAEPAPVVIEAPKRNPVIVEPDSKTETLRERLARKQAQQTQLTARLTSKTK